MAETLFPTRQRCKKCSKGLGANNASVYLGLFCTPKCANMAPVATHPEMAPRECKTQRDGKWGFKRRYRSEQEMPDRLRNDPATSWYWCTVSCGHLHVGRSLVDLSKGQNRGLRTRADVADLLVKLRGKATHKQVGAVLGVRPIRIKECEDPKFDSPSLEVLLGLMNVYGADLTAVIGERR